MSKSTVYFCKTISPEKVLEMYKKLGKELPASWHLKYTAANRATKTF